MSVSPLKGKSIYTEMVNITTALIVSRPHSITIYIVVTKSLFPSCVGRAGNEAKQQSVEDLRMRLGYHGYN